MDEDRRRTTRGQAVGAVKELIGKLIGNKRIEAEGAREKAGHAGGRGLGTFPDEGPLPGRDTPD